MPQGPCIEGAALCSDLPVLTNIPVSMSDVGLPRVYPGGRIPFKVLLKIYGRNQCKMLLSSKFKHVTCKFQ